MRPTNTKNLCCTFAYFELFVYGINREIASWKMMMQEECQGRGNDLLPFPIPVDLICRTFTATHCEKLRLNFQLFPQNKMHYQLWVVLKNLLFISYHFVCIMSVSLLDHRLQHGSPGRTKRTICLLSASMDYPAQDHPA